MDEIRKAIALHEASHAIAALEMGLPVEWATIEPGYDEEEDIFFPAAVKITESLVDKERDALAVAVSTAAPSYLPTGDPGLDSYALYEAVAAYEVGINYGLPLKAMQDVTENVVRDHEHKIRWLAGRLLVRGTVTFTTTDRKEHACTQ